MIGPGDPICRSDALVDGKSVKFRVLVAGRPVEAFLIRSGGGYHAYWNRCAHMAIGLDLDDNDFFTLDGSALICKMHAALYAPETGECFAGPCAGGALDRVDIRVAGESIVLGASAE